MSSEPTAATMQPLPEDPDARAAYLTELVERVRAGDEAAESEVASRYLRPVTAILRGRLRDRPEVDDLAQETFRLLLEKMRRGEVRNPERLPAFVAGLARNLAIHHFRGTSKRRADGGSEEVERLESAPAGEPGPLGRLLAGERARLVRGLLGEMATERDRQLLFRFYIAEDDKEEICRDLELSSLHFNRVLHRARQRYRELYEEMAARHGGPIPSGVGSSTSSPHLVGG